MEQVAALAGHSERAWHVSWRADGKLLASCSGDRTIRIWAPASADDPSAARWDCVAVLEDAQNRTIRACEWCVRSEARCPRRAAWC
jgi:WD40 repeat protein